MLAERIGRQLALAIEVAALLVAAAALWFLYVQTKGLSAQTELLAEQVNAQSLAIVEQKKSQELHDRMLIIDRFAPRIRGSEFDISLSQKVVLSGSVENLGENTIIVPINTIGYMIVRCRDNEVLTDDGWMEPDDTDSHEDFGSYVVNSSGNLEIAEARPNKYYTLRPNKNIDLSISIDLPYPEKFESMLVGEHIAINLATIVYDPDQFYFKEYIQGLGVMHGPSNKFREKEIIFPAIRLNLMASRVFAKTDTGWEKSSGQHDCLRTLNDG